MDELNLVVITFAVLAIVSVLIVIYVIRGARCKGLKKKLEFLDIEKNKIASAPISPELSKIEQFLGNEKIEIMYKEWTERLEDIKDRQVPRLNDMILEADFTLKERDYKTTLYKIAKLEMEIYKVRSNSEFLLKEIQDLSSSEERSRKVITGYKKTYRELLEKFKSMEGDYGQIVPSVTLQFANIAKKFEEYENILDNTKLNEVNNIVKIIEEMLKHMTVVIEELPVIVLMSEDLLPKKIASVVKDYKDLLKAGYVLDYLNVEDNIKEAKSKIEDIMRRARVLNIKNSIVELKVLVEYFDNIYADFEKEELARKQYKEVGQVFDKKIISLNKLVSDIYAKLERIKKVYNLSDNDVKLIKQIGNELKKLNTSYRELITHTNNRLFAFSKLVKEQDTLVSRLNIIEESLDKTLETIGSMKNDETRARVQYNEIQTVLTNARNFMREYNLPVIPKSYFIELGEAQTAIKEIIKELDKKPIAIETLNVRVETARDLTLKLYSRAKEITKSAAFAESAIVYGNRYRSNIKNLDSHLAHAEDLFNKGEYQKSLNVTISVLNKIEPGINEKLVAYYQKEA